MAMVGAAIISMATAMARNAARAMASARTRAMAKAKAEAMARSGDVWIMGWNECVGGGVHQEPRRKT